MEAIFRFVVSNQDASVTEGDIRKRIRQATTEALNEATAANRNPTSATTAVEGGIFGLGETAVILAVKHAVEAGVGAAALGAAGAAGKDFYETYLKKWLRTLHLLPSKFKEIASKPEAKADEARGKKTTAKKSVKRPAAKKRAKKNVGE